MRKKFIIAHNWRQADQYVRKENFRIRDFVIVNNCSRALCGHSPENIEFVFLNGWHLNEDIDHNILEYYKSTGAISTFVDF